MFLQTSTLTESFWNMSMKGRNLSWKQFQQILRHVCELHSLNGLSYQRECDVPLSLWLVYIRNERKLYWVMDCTGFCIDHLSSKREGNVFTGVCHSDQKGRGLWPLGQVYGLPGGGLGPWSRDQIYGPEGGVGQVQGGSPPHQVEWGWGAVVGIAS